MSAPGRTRSMSIGGTSPTCPRHGIGDGCLLDARAVGTGPDAIDVDRANLAHLPQPRNGRRVHLDARRGRHFGRETDRVIVPLRRALLAAAAAVTARHRSNLADAERLPRHRSEPALL